MRKAFTLFALLLALLSMQASAQDRTITGKVISSQDNLGIPGVSVVVVGTTIGTVTDIDGNYKLNVPSTAKTIRISSVGMKNKNIDLSASNNIDVTLEEDILKLDEVVVTALGISREKKSLGYSTQQVGGSELTGSGEVNIIEALSGKAAGVQVIGSGGTPGASSKILLRGNSTFTTENQPLMVIDGVPLDNSTNNSIAGDYPFNAGLNGVNNSNRAIDINPNDIETINVLKGPAGSSLYGSRGRNGVIIITTKRANKMGGKPISVTFNSSFETSEVSKLPKLQDEYAQGTGGGGLVTNGVQPNANYSTANPGPDQIHGTADDISNGTSSSWGPTVSSLGLTPHDHFKEFFKTGNTISNDIAISGGTDKASVRFSIGNVYQTGIVPNTDLKRNSIRLNGDTKLSDKITVSGSADYIRTTGTKAQNGSNLSGVMLTLTRAPASFDLKGDGPDGYKYANGSQRQYFGIYDNPYWTAYQNPFKDDINRFLGNVFITYSPLDWLSASYRLGTDVYTDHRKQIFAVGSWDTPEPTGEIWENDKRFRELNGDLLINLKHKFNDDFSGGLTVGSNFNERVNNDLFTRGRDLGVPGFYSLKNATNLYASQSDVIRRTAALYFIADVSYKNLVYLNVTGRNEWSSTFGPNKSSFFYPSVSASFIFSDLIAENKVLSFGKLRLAYAQSGNSPDPYTSTTYFTSAIFTDGFTDGLSFPFLGRNGFGIGSTLGNPNLQSEVLTGTDLGVDLRFLNGRINLDFSYYNQKSTKVLIARPIAASSGYQNFLTNIGEMENKGIEVILSGDPVRFKDFNWNIAVNFSQNKNTVLSLTEGVEQINLESAFESIGSFAIVGEPYGVLFATKWKRSPDGQIIVGSNGVPLVDDLKGKVGDPYPDWLAGIRNTFTYKGITLTGLLDIREGGDIWNGTIARLNRLGRTEASADRTHNYVVPGVVQNPDGSFSPNTKEISAFTYYQKYLGDNGSATEQAIFDGSWVRLREVSLSYKFKFKNSKSFIQGLEISATGRNLWLSTDYPGVDPETSLTGAGSNVGGFDYFNMPGTKSYIVGLRASF